MRLFRRILLALATLVLVVAALGLGAGGWYLADILKKDALTPSHKPGELDMRVLAVGDDEITLEPTPATGNPSAWDHDGVWGIRWDGGYGHVGPIRLLSEDKVVRDFTPFYGRLQAGDLADLEGFAFPGDPQVAFGIPFQQVQYTSPLGQFNAWFVPAAGKTWAIFVHGRNATPREALRILPTVVELGHPALVIGYRNDEDAPPNPDGLLRYGQAEWQDLEGAVSYALSQGAQDVVLVGYSMGGAIVMSFLYQSDLADHVRGVILDAPMVNFNKTIDLGVQRRGYPVLVAGIAKGMAQLRFGVDWGKLDYLKEAEHLKAPTLLFHGDADPTVPIATSEALAKARPELVRFVPFAGALHVGAWNSNPTVYEAEVKRFLEEMAQK
ncbi:MAG: alpha/beta hydrolase [Chloroflexi bacterium]|nr:alpha/beta hydrolase [Chloroflexota bacterium]